MSEQDITSHELLRDMTSRVLSRMRDNGSLDAAKVCFVC